MATTPETTTLPILSSPPLSSHLLSFQDVHEELHFEGREDAARRSRGFGIWSLQFSSDGREIVAGTSDHALCVFDVERNEPVLHVRAHGVRKGGRGGGEVRRGRPGGRWLGERASE